MLLQMEHGVLEKEHVPSFVQQISEVIEFIHDNPQAAFVAGNTGAERPSVEPLSDAKVERVADEIDGGGLADSASVNLSPPCGSSPSNAQMEVKPELALEVCFFRISYVCGFLHSKQYNCMIIRKTWFPHLLQREGFFFLKIPGPGKVWKITFILESPGH